MPKCSIYPQPLQQHVKMFPCRLYDVILSSQQDNIICLFLLQPKQISKINPCHLLCYTNADLIHNGIFKHVFCSSLFKRLIVWCFIMSLALNSRSLLRTLKSFFYSFELPQSLNSYKLLSLI